jgi:hypothetical protein
MKTMLLLALLVPLAGCALNDFVQKQQEWNAHNGMGSMNAGVEIPGGHSDSTPSAAPSEPAFTPPAASEMHCTGTSTSSSGANAGAFSSSSSCHN